MTKAATELTAADVLLLLTGPLRMKLGHNPRVHEYYQLIRLGLAEGAFPPGIAEVLRTCTDPNQIFNTLDEMFQSRYMAIMKARWALTSMGRNRVRKLRKATGLTEAELKVMVSKAFA